MSLITRKTNLESYKLNELSRYIIDHLSIKKFSIKQRTRTFYLLKKYLQLHNISNNECLKLIEDYKLEYQLKISFIYIILCLRDLDLERDFLCFGDRFL
jgi:hypothetical protein